MFRSILSSKFSVRAGARAARWQSRLVPNSYAVEYIPGHRVPGADALSPLPDPLSRAPDEHAEDELVIAEAEVENLTLDHVHAV